MFKLLWLKNRISGSLVRKGRGGGEERVIKIDTLHLFRIQSLLF